MSVTARSKRSIAPNEGFTEQLIELSDAVHGKTNSKANSNNMARETRAI